MIAHPCSHLTKQAQCGRGKCTAYKILFFSPGYAGHLRGFSSLPSADLLAHLLGIMLLWPRRVLYLTQQFKFHPAISHTSALETLRSQWPLQPQLRMLLPRATVPWGWEDSVAAPLVGRGGGRRAWGCSMSVAVLRRWKPHEAELSATLQGISRPPRNCTLRLQWLCKHFCRRWKPLAPSEKAGLEEPRETTRAGSGRCIAVHYQSCTTANPKIQHIFMSELL